MSDGRNLYLYKKVILESTSIRLRSTTYNVLSSLAFIDPTRLSARNPSDPARKLSSVISVSIGSTANAAQGYLESCTELLFVKRKSLTGCAKAVSSNLWLRVRTYLHPS